MEMPIWSGRSEGTPLLAAGVAPSHIVAPPHPTPELEVGLVQHGFYGRGTAVAADPGKLAGGEPGSVIPDPRLEPWIQVRKLRFETGFALVLHRVVLGVHF